MANQYGPRDMSEPERRRRAAARAKRRRQIIRNRIIFAVACLVILAALIFGIVKLAGYFANEDRKLPVSSSQSTSQTENLSAAEPSFTPEPVPPASAEPSFQPAESAVPVQQQEGDWLLTLVNNNIPLPENWSVNIKVAEPGNQKELADVAADAYQQMKGAAALDGIELLLCSGYRTVEYQQNLFDQQKEKSLKKGLSEQEAFNEAKKVVAVPGYSEHNSGLAADIVTPKHQALDAAFGETEAGQWLAQHAHEYGFILRYPENKQTITGIIYEPWHFRYVGVENAKAITESGKCLEEYLDENS